MTTSTLDLPPPQPHTHSLGTVGMCPEVVFLYKETREAVVMKEQVRFLQQCQFPLPITRTKHCAHHIEGVLYNYGRGGPQEGEKRKQPSTEVLFLSSFFTIFMCFFAFLAASMATSTLRGVSGSSEAHHKDKLCSTYTHTQTHVETDHTHHQHYTYTHSPGVCPALRLQLSP